MSPEQALHSLQNDPFETINDAADVIIDLLKCPSFIVKVSGPQVCAATRDSVIATLILSNVNNHLIGTYMCECHALDDTKHIGDRIPFANLHIYQQVL